MQKKLLERKHWKCFMPCAFCRGEKPAEVCPKHLALPGICLLCTVILTVLQF